MFKYKLQAVLNYKKRIEEDRQKEFAIKNRTLLEEKEKLSAYLNDKKKYEKNMSVEQRKNIGVEDLKTYFSYFERVKTSCEAQTKKISEAEQQAEVKRKELLTAMRERKTIEILREKEYKRYVDAIREKEQKMIDEVVVTRYRHSTSGEMA